MTNWFCNSFSSYTPSVRLKGRHDKQNISNSSNIDSDYSSKLNFTSRTMNLDSNFKCFNDLQSSSLALEKESRLNSFTQFRKRFVDDMGMTSVHFTDSSTMKNTVKRRKFLEPDSLSVSEQADPVDEEDLAVHYKKAQELKHWIRTKMGVERGGKTLLLTGPCGSAKTTTVKTLCVELGVEVMEFDCTSQEYELSHNGSDVWDKSALRVFFHFIRTSQLTSIEKMSLKHRLLLIEQLPNIFYQDVQLFHESLREFVNSSRCIIVFVMSNIDSCWELNARRLFPVNILDELAISHIKFNPISVTNMTKAVKRILTILKFKLPTGNASTIKQIAILANGDIRKAMNLIDFFVTRKFTASLPNSNMKSLTNNEHVELFHFIGKLMYAKRADFFDNKWLQNEQMLLKKCKMFERPFPFKDDLNLLLDSCFVSGDFLSSYVFEHEPFFAPSIKSLKSVALNLCKFDVFACQNLDVTHILDKYVLEVSARSAVYYNYHTVTFKPAACHNGLYQFDKPKHKRINQKRSELKRSTLDLFLSMFLRTSDIDTLVLPMLSLMFKPNTSKAQLDVFNKFQLPNAPTSKLHSYKSVMYVTSQPFAFTQQNLLASDNYDEFDYMIEEII